MQPNHLSTWLIQLEYVGVKREMHVASRMLGKPFTDRRGLMSGVVVADQVDVQFCRNFRIDLDKELAKLDGAMPTVQT